MTRYTLLAAAILFMPVLCGDASAEERARITVQTPQPDQVIRLGRGSSISITSDRPFKTINIIDSNIVDALANTDRNATLVGKTQGTTGVTLLDENNRAIGELLVIVDEVGLGRVKLHNQARLGSVSIYRCGTTGCELVDEQIMKAPAPVLTNNERREIIIRRAPAVGMPEGTIGY